MNTLLLHPTDILFFRDGRPMSGSLAGHGAAWPLPTVLNAALHAALWRADLEKLFGSKVHGHDQIRLYGGKRDRISEDTRKFGSLVTAGPFPVWMGSARAPRAASGAPPDVPVWFFPRPADAEDAGSSAVTLLPVARPAASSLPDCLTHAIANTRPPTKAKPAPWWSRAAWQAYLGDTSAQAQLRPTDFKDDTDFSDTEHTIGIGISPDTGTQNGEQFYSAHCLRLRAGWLLGAFAEARDKDFKDKSGNNDLIQTLFPNSDAETQVIVGGQQRLCSVARHSNVESSPLPLPHGVKITGHRVKWILLTPAVWPAIGEHTGGWLPSWVRHTDGQVMLKTGETARRDGEGREAWRKRVATELSNIPARLVAAITGKPLAVTGYALPNSADPDRPEGGAKSTHLAVPAGAVYYFQANSEPDAQALANALNWHGNATANPTTIRNRRSTLMGEKGFGLGVCGTWELHPGSDS